MRMTFRRPRQQDGESCSGGSVIRTGPPIRAYGMHTSFYAPAYILPCSLRESGPSEARTGGWDRRVPTRPLAPGFESLGARLDIEMPGPRVHPPPRHLIRDPQREKARNRRPFIFCKSEDV